MGGLRRRPFLMLDHVFLDAIGALRDSLEDALLERQAFEESFTSDLLLGDIGWSTSYGLPGEGLPPRVRADIVLDWPTWAQTAYRSWYIGEPFTDPPSIDVELTVRLQRLARHPELGTLLAALPAEGPMLGRDPLARSAPTVSELVMEGQPSEFGTTISYEGRYELDEEILADGSAIDRDLSALGGWISSTLVRIGDLPFTWLPPLERPGLEI